MWHPHLWDSATVPQSSMAQPGRCPSLLPVFFKNSKTFAFWKYTAASKFKKEKIGEESTQTKLLELGSCGNIPNKEKQENNCNIKNRWLPACKFFADLVDWSVVNVCWPATSWLRESSYPGTVLRAQKSLLPILETFVFSSECWHHEPFPLDLSAYQRWIPYLLFHSYVSKENLLDVENTLEQRRCVCTAPSTFMMPARTTNIAQE